MLLGYYADMLFTKHSGAFVKTMDFLFKSMAYALETPELVIALQSIDTLNTVVSDTDLAPRLEELLPRIVEILGQQTATIPHVSFFEFMQEFVKFYAVVLSPYILQILTTMVQRIVSEQQKPRGEDKSPQIIQSKCWNVIRIVVDRHEYQSHQAEIEILLTPLFMFLADPSQISFEDDIVMCVKAVIRRTKRVTST